MQYKKKKEIFDSIIKDKIIFFLTKNSRASIEEISKEFNLSEEEVKEYLKLIKKDYYFTVRRKDRYYKHFLSDEELVCENLGLNKKLLKDLEKN